MASQSLVDGDLFVEVVDNTDGGGMSPDRKDELRVANREGRLHGVAFPHERSNVYNGIRQLYHRAAPDENVFGAALASSMNFEFVFNSAGRTMTPRWITGSKGSEPTPSSLTRVGDNSARLEVNVPAPHRVDVATMFTLVPPHYVDLRTEIVPLEESFAGDWLGVFWANYINRPEGKTTYFRGRETASRDIRVVSSLDERPDGPRAFAAEGADLLPNEPDSSGTLFHNIRPQRFVEPFFYGKWRDMVLMMMFETDLDLRFAIQPTGGGLLSPAWDFATVIRDCEPGRTYTWSGRLLFKQFVVHDDMAREYGAWGGSASQA